MTDRELSCAVIYGDESTEHPDFLQAAEQYFDTVLGVPFDSVRTIHSGGTRLMYRDTDLSTFDCVFLRLFGSDMLYGERIPALLNQQVTYTQLDEQALFVANNKFYTIKVLGAGGVPVPRSAYVLSTAEAEKAADQFGYPAVLKLISGYGGEGVMRVPQADDLAALVDTLTLFEQEICLQEYIENPGEDIRIVVIGGDTYSYKRIGGEEEWRSNVATGGYMEPFDAPTAMRTAAMRAAQLSGCDICGVDVIEGEDRFVIGEVNASPSLKGDKERVGVDLYDQVMQHMYEQTKQRT